MSWLRFFVASSPVLLLALLVIGWKMSALSLSIWGILFTAAILCWFFDMTFGAVLLAALDGLVTTIPLLFIVFFGIILSALLIHTGALPRIVSGLSRGFRNSAHQLNGICFGIENFVAGAGIMTEPIIAPTFRTIGIHPVDAAVLSSWGYAGIMSFTIGGVFVVLLSIVTGLDPARLALISTIISIVPIGLFGAAMPMALKVKGIGGRNALLSTASALACGLLTLLCVVYVSWSTACMLAGTMVLGGIILLSGNVPDLRGIRFVDILPFLVLIVGLSVVNLHAPLRSIANDRAVISMTVLPVHPITFRPLLDASLYLLLAITATIVGFRMKPNEVGALFTAVMPRAARAMLAMILFGAMGQMIGLSGYDALSGTIVRGNNIPYLLASGLYNMSGRFYPIFAPVLGWAGTFLAGYGSLSVMIFGKLQVEMAELIRVAPETLSSAMMVGSGIGSVSSPFKVAMACSLVDAVGKEGTILRRTIPLGIAISLITGIWAFIVGRVL